MIIVRIIAFPIGVYIVGATLISAIRTFVLPRSAPDRVSRFVFRRMRLLFDWRLKNAKSYEDRDRVMAFYAPIAILTLLPVWLILITIGFMAMYGALGVDSITQAFAISGSSLLTLGSEPIHDFPMKLVAFSEATIGLIMVALLIAYLPTMYTAFARREAAVTMLEVRAGSPPSAVEMLLRFKRISGWDRLHEMWVAWEIWFADIEESHTSLAALSFFRSPQPDRSWITAAGAVLDAASLAASTLDFPRDAQAELCIRAGYIALRRICDFFGIKYNATPKADDPISIDRHEYDAVYDQLVAAGIPVKSDRDAAWRAFSGWRINYDTVLLALATLTMAPYAPWSSDRSLRRMHPPSKHKKPGQMVKPPEPAKK